MAVPGAGERTTTPARSQDIGPGLCYGRGTRLASTPDRARRHGMAIGVQIITGFLGSGKTTLVRHLVEGPGAGRVGVVVGA